jgi:methylthioribulose-1-phosphate dehydratase
MSDLPNKRPALADGTAFADYTSSIQGLIETGQDFHRRGWSLGTSSNYSVVVERDPTRLLLTGSGYDKGRLQDDHFVLIDGEGEALPGSKNKPSAETLLHVVLARSAGAGSILHTHSVEGTLLSEAFLSAGKLVISGYEMLKGLQGITTHDCSVEIEIFPNTQDIAALAKDVEARLIDPIKPLKHGFLIAGHGLYTWGADLASARRHIEVLEFLFKIVTQKRLLNY